MIYQFVKIVLAAIIGYIAGSIAIDTASLWMYALVFISMGYIVKTLISLGKQHETSKQPAAARRASAKTTQR